MVETKGVGSRPSVKALERGLDILDYLFQVREERLHHIAEQMQTPASTLHRLLGVFEEHGYVISHQGTYQLGLKGLWLTSSREPIRKILEELSHEVGETTNFAMRIHGEMEFLERSVSDHPLSFVVSIGSRVPLHCTAMGKAVLAFEPELLEHLDLSKETSTSITDPIELQAELEVVRHRGFALDNEELVPGVFCAAVPVFGPHHQVLGAVSISGPVVRFSRDRAFQTAPHLKEAGERISRLLQ